MGNTGSKKIGKWFNISSFQVWELFREGELERMVDLSIGKDVDMDEACLYLKIGLLCTQSLLKNRPSMSNVMKMLNDEMSIDEKDLSDPCLLSDLMSFKTAKNNTSGTSSSGSGKPEDSTIYDSSHATMTFTSIADR